MPAFTATAPGKIILFGEHAVVYGHPGIAAPVRQLQARAVVMAEPNAPRGRIRLNAPDINLEATLDDLPAGHPMVVAIKGVLDELNITHPPAFFLTLTSSIPSASGLGSGAAVAVAMTRALSAFLGHPLTDERISALAYEVEKIHHGTPSGIDNTVISYQKPVYFRRTGERNIIETFPVPAPFTIVIGDTGVRSSTYQVVSDVHQHWQADPAKYGAIFNEIGVISEKARTYIQSGKPMKIGELMNANQLLLEEIGVSSLELARLIEAAHSAGATGAKLSGGGRGGNMIALVEKDTAQAVAQRLEQAGAVRTIITTIQT